MAPQPVDGRPSCALGVQFGVLAGGGVSVDRAVCDARAGGLRPDSNGALAVRYFLCVMCLYLFQRSRSQTLALQG